MSPIHRFSQIVLLFICASSLPAIAAPATTQVTARIKIANDHLIVVPVTINGSGPYDFVVDTGSNNTMLDQKLADELALPRGKATTIFGVKGSMSVSAAYAESLSIAGATVDGKGLSLFSSANLRSLPPRVRGILGEDFLQNFDILIDYRHQIIQLESGLASLAEALSGERLPVQLTGTRQGESTFGRLIVLGRIHELGDKPISLLLDSCVNNLILFRDTLGPGSNRQELFVDVGTFKPWGITTMETKTVRRLNLGRNEVNDPTVIAVGQQELDTDGLIPTSLFHSIFISHQGRFVILNPSLPKGSR